MFWKLDNLFHKDMSIRSKQASKQAPNQPTNQPTKQASKQASNQPIIRSKQSDHLTFIKTVELMQCNGQFCCKGHNWKQGAGKFSKHSIYLLKFKNRDFGQKIKFLTSMPFGVPICKPGKTRTLVSPANLVSLVGS